MNTVNTNNDMNHYGKHTFISEILKKLKRQHFESLKSYNPMKNKIVTKSSLKRGRKLWNKENTQ